jgi:hypothetical protein
MGKPMCQAISRNPLNGRLPPHPAQGQRAFLIGVQTPEMPEGEGEELLAELTELVENLGLSVVRTTS